MLVGVVMGSESDWTTMRAATETLVSLMIPYEVKVISAHRTPDLLFPSPFSASPSRAKS